MIGIAGQQRHLSRIRLPSARGCVAADRYDPAAAKIPARIHLAMEKLHTLGAWGEAA
jgi:hypothetical protein